MNAKRTLSALGPFVMVLCFLGFQGEDIGAQTTLPRDTLLAAARDIIEAARYCGLATVDESGTPRIRTMDPFAPEEDMTIWMGTKRDSRKVQEIDRDPRVTLYYFPPNAAGYVSITGQAQVVDDERETASRWKSEWEAFYEDRASEYVLIRVVPERLELVDYSRGIVGDPGTWEPPFLVFTRDPPQS